MVNLPVMQYETKYGIDFRVGATEVNTRSGSIFVGYLRAPSKPEAILRLKLIIKQALASDSSITPNSDLFKV